MMEAMDDEEMVRNIAKQILKQLAYEHEVAKDAAEPVELYRKTKESGEPFDAVILDLIVKGGWGGKGAVKTFLEIDLQAKAIVSRGYSGDPAITDFMGYGFVGVLPKSYTMKDLIDALNKVMMKKSG